MFPKVRSALCAPASLTSFYVLVQGRFSNPALDPKAAEALFKEHVLELQKRAADAYIELLDEVGGLLAAAYPLSHDAVVHLDEYMCSSPSGVSCGVCFAASQKQQPCQDVCALELPAPDTATTAFLQGHTCPTSLLWAVCQ